MNLINKIVPAGLVCLLAFCPRVFPAHGRSEPVNSAYCFVGIMIFKSQERAFIQKHAAIAAIFTISRSIPIHGQYQTCRHPLNFPGQTIHLLFNLLQII